MARTAIQQKKLLTEDMGINKPRKILFVTDLHGNIAKYRRVFEAAIKHGVAAVVYGGDMLALDGDLHGSQRDFIEGFLSSYFTGYEKAGIYHLGFLGNDDLKIHDDVFDETCHKHKHVVNLAQRRFELNDYEFIGMNWVADYPFRLKDRCRRDGPGYVFQEQFGSGLLSTPEGFKELEDWPAYAAKLPTIEDEFDALPKPAAASRTIYVIHMPPSGLGLDVISSGAKVGSQAVSRFIAKTQPLLTLHGHIHESPAISGIWKARIGETVCVQPGQMKVNALSYALIDLESMEMERVEEPL
jgi:Icc-related predicted phosphoesterase